MLKNNNKNRSGESGLKLNNFILEYMKVLDDNQEGMNHQLE